MKKLTVAAVIVIVASTFVVATPVPAGAALRSRTFRTPSKNIGCGFYSGSLRCDILSGLKPEPKRHCEVDWTGLNLEAQGAAGPVCAGDTVYDRRSPILDYGRRWKRRGIVCISRRTGLTCRNEQGRGFFLSRERWDTF